jgi:hypothetical protein
MKLNINTAVLWSFCAGVGYLIGETVYTTVAGLTLGLGISLVTEIIFNPRQR